MISHASVAAKVRQHKIDHPEFYCVVPGCLWRTVTSAANSANPCRKHPQKTLEHQLSKSIRSQAPSLMTDAEIASEIQLLAPNNVVSDENESRWFALSDEQDARKWENR